MEAWHWKQPSEEVASAMPVVSGNSTKVDLPHREQDCVLISVNIDLDEARCCWLIY